MVICHPFTMSSSSTPKFVPARCSKKQNVLYESYRYSLNKRRGERSYWTCIEKKCSGKLTLQEDSIVVNSSTHNHLAASAEKMPVPLMPPPRISFHKLLGI